MEVFCAGCQLTWNKNPYQGTALIVFLLLHDAVMALTGLSYGARPVLATLSTTWHVWPADAIPVPARCAGVPSAAGALLIQLLSDAADCCQRAVICRSRRCSGAVATDSPWPINPASALGEHDQLVV